MTKTFRRLLRVATITSCSAMSTPAVAQSSNASTDARSEVVPLRYDLPLDLAITGGGIALSASLELVTSAYAPSTCRWCDRDASGKDSLNGFDSSIRNALRWQNPGPPNTASYVIGYGIVPLTSIGLGALLLYRDNRTSEFLVDGLLVAEATVVALNVNQISKLVFARERPYAHYRDPVTGAALRSSEDNLSFFSGHTTFAFALAASTATVASMRHYRLAPVVWVTGMTLAAATGYLRIAADKHYATDVLAGALVGTALGIGIPYLAHGPVESRVSVAAAPVANGGGLQIAGYW